VDITSHAYEWPRGLLRLDNQTRSNADNSAIVRTDVYRSLRRRLLSVARQGRHPETFTKNHVERCLGRLSICDGSHTAV